MKIKKLLTRFLPIFICFVLITAIALTATGCQKELDDDASSAAESAVSDEEKTVTFKLVVIDGEGNETTLDVATTQKTVGAALLEKGIIEGDESQYGLYVKKVNGITADYDVDGSYWAFYIGGEYATSGVDTTDITDGETYTLKVEK